MNSPPRVLIVGAGSIGERHLRCFGSTGRAQMALCEINPELRKSIADRYQISEVFDDYTTALNTRPEVVVLCTPAHLHVPMAIDGAKIGAHLLIEKPLSTTLRGIQELAELTVQQQLVVGIAYVYRSHPALAAMRTEIAQGRFGQPLEIIATCGQHFPLYRPAYREIYYNNHATGGGAVQDALTHIINAGEWLVGNVTRVVSDIAHLALEGVEVEDTANVLARHGSVLGAYCLNQHQAPNETTITVICERGTARFESHHSRWRWMTEPGGNWTDECAVSLERDTLFVRQAEAFLDAVSSRSNPLCSLEQGRHTLKVNLAILRSAESHTWESVPS